MRVSSKGRYAVVALLDVAANSEAKPVSLADVAARQKISLSYLEQLFAMLRRAGLVTASRGPGGGYRLARPDAEIRVSDVFRAVEEGVTAAEGGRDWSLGPAAGLWDNLDDHVERFLERVTLSELRRDGVDLRPLNGAVARREPGLSA
jgi:Rrf2 family transcriptional regulator, iron-sulfur cluster assembly transcription factor